MSPMIESLEGRQMFSVTLITATSYSAPLTTSTTAVADSQPASGKVTTTEITITKTTDKSTPILF